MLDRSPRRQSARPVVLLVESNDDVRELLAEYLDLSGFTTLGVTTTDEALTCATRIDALVTAVTVFGSMDGIELIRQVRCANPRLPVVVVTANVLPKIRDAALAAGSDVVLSKPCVPEDVTRHIRRLLLRRCRGA